MKTYILWKDDSYRCKMERTGRLRWIPSADNIHWTPREKWSIILSWRDAEPSMNFNTHVRKIIELKLTITEWLYDRAD